MYPDRDTLSNVPHSGYITTYDQGMVESGMTEVQKHCHFSFFVNEHNNTNMEPQAKKHRFSKLFQKKNKSVHVQMF